MKIKQLDKYLFGCIIILGDLVSVSSVWGKARPLYIPESLVFCSNVTVTLLASSVYCWVGLAFPFNLIYHFNRVAKEIVQISDVLGNYHHPHCSF